MEEPKKAIKKFKNNKAAGPNEIPMEGWKWPDHDALEIIPIFLRIRRRPKTTSSEFNEVDVVSIFKKGDATNPANYRPIASLNSLYKVHASITKVRLGDAIDNTLWKTQYGCRKGKSTAQLIAKNPKISGRVQ